MIALGVKTGLDEKSISENCRKIFLVSKCG